MQLSVELFQYSCQERLLFFVQFLIVLNRAFEQPCDLPGESLAFRLSFLAKWRQSNAGPLNRDCAIISRFVRASFLRQKNKVSRVHCERRRQGSSRVH